MSGDEIREERIGETILELADAYMRAQEHVLAIAACQKARAADVAHGGDAEGKGLDARGHSEGLIDDLVLLQRIINRAAEHSDVVAKLPSSTMESAENMIRSSLGAAAMVRGVKVPSYEELQDVADEDPLMWVASRLNDSSSTGHVVARGWATEDDA